LELVEVNRLEDMESGVKSLDVQLGELVYFVRTAFCVSQPDP